MDSRGCAALLYGEFKPFAVRNGIDLMRDDLFFIEKVLPRIPLCYRRRVLKQYARVWLDVLELNKDNPIKKQNLARRAANSFIHAQVSSEYSL